MNFLDHIESKPTVMLGKPVIKGTRITVELILKKLSEGATQNDLVDLYPHITKEDIMACLKYASDVISHELVLGDK